MTARAKPGAAYPGRHSGDAVAALRVCFVGDSITTGVGDSGWVGWPIRLCVREGAGGYELTPYNLGVRGDTSEEIRRRWRAECAPRLAPPWSGGIVFAFGVNDACHRNRRRRVKLGRSVENAKAIVGPAVAWRPTLWIGPPSVGPAHGPCMVFTQGVAHEFRNDRIEELSNAFQAAAKELGVPYFNLYRALSDDVGWRASLSRSDGVHPDSLGHARLAEVIGEWSAWRLFLKCGAKPKPHAERG